MTEQIKVLLLWTSFYATNREQQEAIDDEDVMFELRHHMFVLSCLTVTNCRTTAGHFFINISVNILEVLLTLYYCALIPLVHPLTQLHCWIVETKQTLN